MRRSMDTTPARLLGLAALLLGGATELASAQVTVGLGDVRGPTGTGARNRISRALEAEGHTVIEAVDAAEAFEQGAAAFVNGRMRRRGSRLVGRFKLWLGADGEPATLTAASSRMPRVVNKLMQELLPALPEEAPQAEAEPEPEEPGPDVGASEDEREEEEEGGADEDEAEEGDPTPRGDLPTALLVDLGGGIVRRQLRYKDDLYGFLRPHDLFGTALVEMSATWFPGAHLTGSWAAHIGLDLHFANSLGGTSDRNDGRSFETTYRRFGVRLRGRIPFGAHNGFVAVGYGRRTLELSADAPADATTQQDNLPQIPNVNYALIEAEAGARIVLADMFHVVAGLGWLQVLDAGGIADDVWFPNASALGATARLRLELLLKGFSVYAETRYDRFWHALKPEVDASGQPVGQVAGGALDQQMNITLGVGYRL